MKNIHVIPTDKPSRLGYLTKKGKEVYKDLRVFDKLMPNILDSENQHIYITSDEEIKEGNWVNDGTNNPYKWTKNDVEDCLYNPGVANYKGCKKIILTTDQSLNGVQAIDDEFLEWFVKNPSCDEVDIADLWKEGTPSAHDSYKIIIPKEEPKQETLEEAAKRLSIGIREENYQDGIIEGAKWMQERMYSEEDMLEFTKYLLSKKITKAKSISDLEEYLPKEFQLLLGELMRNSKELISEWFEQFKNK